MIPEYKTFSFKIDDADSKGIIRGYASTFNNTDLGWDVMEEGAFKKTLKESKGIVPILADHDPTKQIGWNVRAEESKDGLLVEGKINMESQLGRERYALAKQALDLGAKMGLSIGYGVVKSAPDKDRPQVRRLKEVKLYEYSMVTFPMNQEAMITAAKSYEGADKIAFLISLFNEQAKSLGIDPSVAKEALLNDEGAAKLINDPYEADPTLISQSLDRLIEQMKYT